MTHYQEEIKESKAGLVANIIGAIAFLASGICLLVLNADFIARLVYSFLVLGFGILFICFGTYYMIKYFFNHEFARITSYSFTMGVIFVIIGAVFIMYQVLLMRLFVFLELYLAPLCFSSPLHFFICQEAYGS